ncbi:M48 family metallopeptidase [Guptibacillus hwajinpoensis]|uniref:Zn-dependent protease with chaperone function n=1 Tax=Guptibacillus hwajinpoensis TaxID=208199 RepID=A0ABU0K5I7_9BACL|nr:M48 family metallopeptidase [Alkalihalobacillus hemicentroti]MDQ0484608.1 Zn-dependent protease with chaperone function [Alkalihalobacillus hemicentroti]
MMKKRITWIILGFSIYALFMGLYLFSWADFGVPEAYKGTAADPATFMTERELQLSEEYSRYRNFLSFIAIPFEWIIYLGVLGFGLSKVFKQFSEGISKKKIVVVPLYILLLTAFTWVLTFPLQYWARSLSVKYGINTQSFSGWMKDEMVSFWINVGLTSLVIGVLYALIKRFKKKWWLAAWGLMIPYLAFMMYIQPVVIDPLYNDFTSLSDKELEEQILDMAETADIPANRVFEVNMSEKTNAMNAYVSGIGSNLRIVLWDTTMNKLDDDEVLFIMAHEMGHYVMNHLYGNLIGALGTSLIGLYLAYRLLGGMIRKWGKSWGISSEADLASLPALFLLFSVMSFVASPVELAISRHAEVQADEYAIEMTEDVDAAVGSFQTLTVNSLNEVNPPFLVKYLKYGHPTMMERLIMLNDYKKNTQAE